MNPQDKQRRVRRIGGGRALAILALMILGTQTSALAASIVVSKHNLSVSGPGDVKASTEGEICIFCHTPHNAGREAPLWNRYSSGATYVPYNSTTLKARVGQPTGASKLCLSCHDGTVALGQVRSRPDEIMMDGGMSRMPANRASNLGTDLSDDHPVSFKYDTDLASRHGQLQDPTTLNQQVRLDKQGEMQCTSCHDPHNDQYGQFLVRDNTASGLCMECHRVNFWTASSHRNSSATWNGQGIDPWPRSRHNTVAANACESCHAPHGAGTPHRLLNHADEERNCFVCHNGNVAGKNIEREFRKLTSRHPIDMTLRAHDPEEETLNPVPRHVTCADCHNPHAAGKAGNVQAPNASAAIAGVRGVSAAGTVVNQVTREYELCFRCHADSVSGGKAFVDRQHGEIDTRREFNPANASFHPVMATGKNMDVPSLLHPWTETSQMYCTDCHNNNEGPGAGGTGPRGPHGSAFAPLLERQLVFNDGSLESSASYAMCYKCHDRQILMNEALSFKYHRKHVMDVKAACTTCHDPHGVPGNTHLINFNTKYVERNAQGRIEFLDTGSFRGTCSLKCHGENGGTINHNNTSYSR